MTDPAAPSLVRERTHTWTDPADTAAAGRDVDGLTFLRGLAAATVPPAPIATTLRAATGHELGAGPRGCAACDLADGVRFGARETDRPGAVPGNEHAVRVASAVTRTRDRYTPRARAGYELLLPDLLAGHLPTTPEAQAAKALINRLTPDECDRVASLAEAEDLVGGRA